MPSDARGLHHVTGIAADAQQAVDFYAGTLGLRFVKQTVNFEDVLQHHLYFGDSEGRPGSVVTFFADPHGTEGRVGKPQVAAVALAVPEGSLNYWRDRLADRGVAVEGPETRFDERVLRFTDPVGTRVELETRDAAALPGDPWEDGPVPTDAAIRGIAGVSTLSANPYATASALETLGFEYEREADERVRYRLGGEDRQPGDGGAGVVDVLDREAEFGREGTGTLHHVAVRVDDEDALRQWREVFDEMDYQVSRVKDRHFFHSLYVREPGGILIELATDPGESVDGDPDSRGLVAGDPDPGGSLFLPEWFEPDRELIESQLPELALPAERDGESRP